MSYDLNIYNFVRFIIFQWFERHFNELMTNIYASDTTNILLEKTCSRHFFFNSMKIFATIYNIEVCLLNRISGGGKSFFLSYT